MQVAGTGSSAKAPNLIILPSHLHHHHHQSSLHLFLLFHPQPAVRVAGGCINCIILILYCMTCTALFIGKHVGSWGWRIHDHPPPFSPSIPGPASYQCFGTLVYLVLLDPWGCICNINYLNLKNRIGSIGSLRRLFHMMDMQNPYDQIFAHDRLVPLASGKCTPSGAETSWPSLFPLFLASMLDTGWDGWQAMEINK